MTYALENSVSTVHKDAVFDDRQKQFLSDFTNVEVFEASERASKRQKMGDNEFVSYLKLRESLLPSSQDVRFRAIFIPDTQNDTDQLQMTRSAFGALSDRFDMGSRFAGLLRMQLQPTRRIKYDEATGKPAELQFLYSAIMRRLGPAINPKDPTKRVLDWRRLIVWTTRDLRTEATTMVILRCQDDTKERLLNMIGDGAAGQWQLLRHPMMLHAFFAEDLIVRAKTFSEEFGKPIYTMEMNLGHSTNEYTQRARRFLLLSRQIGNVLIDHDIYLASLSLLKDMYAYIRDGDPPLGISPTEWRQRHIEFDGRTFDDITLDFELTKRYGQLYEERSKLGNNECTTLINQREVEIAKKMAAESTAMARAQHHDSQALRIIQYLGLIFVPLSLCTSVFGMGFFSASPNVNAPGVAFVVANQWWWFLALSVPFTLLVLLVTWLIARWSTRQGEKRRSSDAADLERLLSYTLEGSYLSDMDEKEMAP